MSLTRICSANKIVLSDMWMAGASLLILGKINDNSNMFQIFG